MRILLDTNIFISLEDSSSVLEANFSEFARLAISNRHQLLIHPSSRDDLERDQNDNRKQINLSKILKYPVLENPPDPSPEEIDDFGLSNRTENDRVDNKILFAIYKDAANILVTEDRGIHKKAKRLQIEDRVHYIQQAAQSLYRLHQKAHVYLPNIKEISLHEIDLSMDFFDSLREDYKGFDEWYKRASREGRKAWTYRSEAGEFGAILIYKEEHNEIVTDDNMAIPGKSLKLCTFKVAENVRGRKIGELFLKAAFRYATANSIENIYITMRPEKHDFLEDLCVDFGFFKFGGYQGDNVFIKNHPVKPPQAEDSDVSPLEYHKRYYPHFISDQRINKFIVPIKPVYHKILFPDNQDQLNLFTHSQAGNAIKLAYLCHARIGGISSGDILLFYRSEDKRAITSVGVAEYVHDFGDPSRIVQLVSKRTVYTFDEIVEMSQKRTKVILFRLASHLPSQLKYNWLISNNVVNGPIQTIRRISHESFRKIIKR